MIHPCRTIAAALGCLVLASLGLGEQPSNTLPLENFPAAVAWKNAAGDEAKPAIVAVSTTPTPDGGIRLLLVNPTDQPIEYTGYTVGSWADRPLVGQISPLYERDRLSDAGEWQEDPLGWCGTGAEAMVLPPGHAGEFSAHVAAEGSSRVRLIIVQKCPTVPGVLELTSPTVGTASEKVSAPNDNVAAEPQPPKEEPTNTLPIDRFPVAAAWRENAARATEPTILIEQAAPVAGADPAEFDVRLLLVNPTDEPIEYLGYTVDSWSEPPPAGEIHPFFREERLGDSGMWEPHLLGRCGTGKGTIQVPPGHAGAFHAIVPADTMTRIGANVARSADPEKTIVELWSPPIGPAAGKVPAQAP